MSKRIRANKQSPEENVLVYVFNKKGFIYVDKMVNGKWVLTNNSDDIVYWMYISEEPVTEYFVSVDELHKEIDDRFEDVHGSVDADDIIDAFHDIVECCHAYEANGIPYNIVQSATKGKRSQCFTTVLSNCK